MQRTSLVNLSQSERFFGRLAENTRMSGAEAKEYEEASRKVRRRLGILSLAREANGTMPKLTPLEDFKICAGRFNGKERRYLKSDLQKINKDFLAPTDKVCALKRNCLLSFKCSLQ
uniref:Uncharacterized protein n=1 Tax=Ditylenchus dipsaci TaxID=166011 RepID=A0A915EID5_9BILA